MERERERESWGGGGGVRCAHHSPQYCSPDDD